MDIPADPDCYDPTKVRKGTRDFRRGMKRMTTTTRHFVKASTRAQEQVRAFQGACEPYVRELGKRRRRKVTTKRKRFSNRAWKERMCLHTLPLGWIVDVYAAKERLRYGQDREDAIPWQTAHPAWWLVRSLAIRERSRGSAHRFAKSYLWPGKRRCQP